MARPLKNADLLDEIRTMQEEIRRLRIRTQGGVDDWMHLLNVADGGIINDGWVVDGYAFDAIPEYPDGRYCGIYRTGALVGWEGALYWDHDSAGGAAATNLIDRAFRLPVQFRPQNFIQFTLISDVNNNRPQDNFFTTFQASNDGWAGFSQFVYFTDLRGTSTTSTVHNEPIDNAVSINLDNIVYRAAPLTDMSGDPS